MNFLIYFVLGILFVEIILPILEQLSAVLVSWLEVVKGKATVHITRMNDEIQKMGLPETSTHVIGFRIPQDDEEEEDDE